MKIVVGPDVHYNMCLYLILVHGKDKGNSIKHYRICRTTGDRISFTSLKATCLSMRSEIPRSESNKRCLSDIGAVLVFNIKKH